MNNSSKPRSYWPIAITIYFTLAVIFLGSFIVWALRQKEDLVSENYYENEIKFQQQLDRLNQTQPIAAEVSVAYDAIQSRIVIALPIAQLPIQTGRVQFYRPSDASLDFRLPLAVDQAGVQSVDARALQPGLWKVRVQWMAAGKEFFVERAFTNAPAKF